MVSAHAIRNVVGIIGNVISFGLFLSPTPTFWRIIKKKDVEQFQYYPYVATVLNCLFWVFYGLPIVKPDSILIVTINGVGLVIELIYLSIYLFYAKDNKKRSRVCLLLLAEAIFMAAIVLITLLVFHTNKRRTFFVGVFCDAFNIIMYGSPLLVWRKVIKTESVEYMPFWLSLAGFLNGGCWTAYALIQLDVFVLISNGLGFLLGTIQLLLYGYYWMYGKPKTVNDNVLKPSDIQLTARDDAAIANMA